MGLKPLLRRLLPPGSPGWQTARRLKRVLLGWYFRRRYGWGPHLRQHFPDPYQPRAFNAFLVRCRGTPFTWDAGVADQGMTQAARAVLGILQARPELRREFPRALADGVDGPYCRWLITQGQRLYSFSGRAVDHIRKAFTFHLGKNVFKLYDHDDVMRQLFPLAFIPNGLECFVRHLNLSSKPHFGLTDEEIWWFLFERAEDPGHGLAACYLRQPSFQRVHPNGLTPTGQRDFLRWVGDKFEIKDRWLRDLDFTRLELPEMAQVNDQADAGPHTPGVNVIGHFCYPSGLRQASRTLVESLRRAGLGTSCRDMPGVRAFDLPDRDRYLGLETYGVTLLPGAPTTHLDDPYELSGLDRKPGVYRIAYWYWELEEVPADWAKLGRQVQEIWAPTRFVAEALRPVMPAPVRVMLPGVELGPVSLLDRARFGLPADRFLFLFVFDMASVMERKNPLGLIRAYQRAFRGDDFVQLAVKVSRGNYVAEDLAQLRAAAGEAGVILIDQDLSRPDTLGLIQSCDAYVSLHRSEGFGLTMAEAMLLGKPVIATRYSGNLDFMTDANSRLVDFTKVPITESLPIYRKGCLWAEPAVEHAAHCMRWAYERQDEARQLGLKAQREMRELLSLCVAGQRMAQRLRDISANLPRVKEARLAG